ncbi:MAG TPA: Rieske (2Fe-2S) protein [Baekduia sp.]|jgi:3-phenylpropionate/trans-cinnamate dioxygenase ferredoxin subunit
MSPTKTRRRVAFPASELPPGTRKVVTMGKREIAVLNVDSKLYAIYNRCPHQRAPLDAGPLGGTNVESPVGEFRFGMEGQVLRCPWHHYEFDLNTGRCLADPQRLRVAVYDVQREGDEIAVYA